jgi:2-C-methyl-D-erythritol 4-phosphate cytidylyltransferase
MKKWAIIVAGGSGLRMGQAMPKQFLMLADRPLLSYTIEAFFQAYEDIRIVLVLPRDFMSMGEQLIEVEYAGKQIQLTQGGATRFDSVKNGLALTDRQDAIVFVHDGVRCLVSPSLIRRCYEKAIETGAVIPAIAANDSIRLRSQTADSAGGNPTAVLNRDRVLLVQTPQTFYAHWLHEAFTLSYQEHFTDEATVVEQKGRSIAIVEGEETNIKITRPVDLLIAERYLQQRSNS